MVIDTNIQEFTDADLLKLNRKAQAEIYAYGSSVGANGKQLTRADLPALLDAQRELESRINSTSEAANGNGGGIALVQFGKPQ